MNKSLKAKFFICLVLLFIFIFPLLIVSAEVNLKYRPLESIPGFPLTNNFAVFISNLYKFGIWTVGICALIMIVIGGYMYAASGGNNASMEKAKGFITDAIIGLVLALLAYLILYVINPELVNIKMAAAVPPAPPSAPGPPSGLPTAPLPPAPKPAPPPSGPSAPGPPSDLPPAEKSACQQMKSQVPSQCSDASPSLNSLLKCLNEKLGNTIQISSISDGNGGVNCYQDNPTWSQCTPSKQTNCCFHKENSCHYGGTGCAGKSYAVDFSDKGSSATNTEIKQAVESCGGRAIDEGDHIHASVGNCGCV